MQNLIKQMFLPIMFFLLLLLLPRPVGARTEDLKLTPSPTWYKAGQSVAMSGDLLAIGAPHEAPGGWPQWPGMAYVYEYNGSSWVQRSILEPPEWLDGDMDFGFSIDITANHVIVGAPEYDAIDCANYGMAAWYERQGDSWVFQDARGCDCNWPHMPYAGSSVAIDNDKLVIGAPVVLANGIVRCLQLQGSEWTTVQWLNRPEEFGHSASMSGDWLVVGDPFYAGHGLAYLFRWSGSDWQEYDTFYESSAYRFGESVSIDGDYMVVGAPLTDNYVGKVYFYRYDARSGDWKLEGSHPGPSSGGSQCFYGRSVAFDSNTECAAIGTKLNSEQCPNGGYVSLVCRILWGYPRPVPMWLEFDRLYPSDPDETDDFGVSVAITEDFVAAGAPYWDGFTPPWFIRPDAGAVYLYNR